MKKGLALLLLYIPFTCYTQDWNHLYDNTYEWRNITQSAHTSYDGGYYIYDYDIDDYFRFIKTDIDGNFIWRKTYRYSVSDYFGRGWMNTDTLGNVVYSGAVKYDSDKAKITLLKLNPCGEILWCRTIDTPYDYIHYGMAPYILPNNDIIVHTRYLGSDAEREQLIKFSEDGDIIWMNQILPEYENPDHNNVFLESYIVASDGGYYLAGTVYKQDSMSGTTFWYPKGIVVKTDEFGDEEFVSYFDYPDENISMVFNSLQETETDMVVSGYDYLDQELPRPTPTVCSIDRFSGELKLRRIQYLPDDVPTGQCLGIKKNDFGFMGICPIQIDSSLDKNKLQIKIFNDSLIAYDSILFENRVPMYDLSFLSCGNNSAIVTGLEWKDPYTTSDSKGMAMKINQDLSIAEMSNIQLEYDSLCPYTIQSDETICDCFPAFYVGIENNKIITVDDLKGIKVFPNPATDIITLETKFISKNRTVQIHDIAGTFINEYILPEKATSYQVNTSTMNKGTYIARLFIEGQETSYSKFIIL